MEPLVPSGAQDWRPSLSRYGFVASLLRELARTPLLCRLRREPEVTGTVLPVLALPDNLQVYIFHLCGVPGTFNASLSCRLAHAQLWQSATFWRAFLQLFGATEASLREDLGLSHCCHRSPVTAKAFRDFARHLLFGIDVLVGRPVQLKAAAGIMSLAHRRHDGLTNAFNLEDARRAVLAMQLEDGGSLIQCATDAIVELLRNRARGEKELQKAENLLEAVASRAELFSTGQMLDMLGGHQKADEALSLEVSPKFHERISLSPCGVRSPSRRARRAAAVAA